jgi:hypothetical protein
MFRTVWDRYWPQTHRRPTRLIDEVRPHSELGIAQSEPHQDSPTIVHLPYSPTIVHLPYSLTIIHLPYSLSAIWARFHFRKVVQIRSLVVSQIGSTPSYHARPTILDGALPSLTMYIRRGECMVERHCSLASPHSSSFVSHRAHLTLSRCHHYDGSPARPWLLLYRPTRVCESSRFLVPISQGAGHPSTNRDLPMGISRVRLERHPAR